MLSEDLASSQQSVFLMTALPTWPLFVDYLPLKAFISFRKCKE